MIKERILAHQEEKTLINKNIHKYSRLSFSFVFSKLCFMVKAKITLSDVVLNVYRETILDNHIINGGRTKCYKGSKCSYRWMI